MWHYPVDVRLRTLLLLQTQQASTPSSIPRKARFQQWHQGVYTYVEQTCTASRYVPSDLANIQMLCKAVLYLHDVVSCMIVYVNKQQDVVHDVLAFSMRISGF